MSYKKIKGKKGADKIISVYWFAILFIVAAAMVYMVSSFYGKPFDVREVETGLLSDKIADCISYGGYMQDVKDILQDCYFNFNTEDVYGWGQQGQYYLRVDIYDFNADMNAEPLKEMTAGNINLVNYCGQKGEGLPNCLDRDLYTIDEQGNQYRINILSIVRKTEKNA